LQEVPRSPPQILFVTFKSWTSPGCARISSLIRFPVLPPWLSHSFPRHQMQLLQQHSSPDVFVSNCSVGTSI
jgi:hypothetical protein